MKPDGCWQPEKDSHAGEEAAGTYKIHHARPANPGVKCDAGRRMRHGEGDLRDEDDCPEHRPANIGVASSLLNAFREQDAIYNLLDSGRYKHRPDEARGQWRSKDCDEWQ